MYEKPIIKGSKYAGKRKTPQTKQVICAKLTWRAIAAVLPLWQSV